MIWLNPAAWMAIAIVAAPVLVHLLVHRRAERFPFPTLRFIRPTRLAAIRRHVIEDLALLAVRSAIIAAAVAALAGPLIVTPARRASWNARLVRAIVLDSEVARGFQPGDRDPAFRTERFETSSLPDGIHRAAAWLDTAPPARRELVVVAPLTIGSVSDADVAAVPREIGVRFERRGEVPESRNIAGGPLLAAADTPVGPVLRQRTVTLAGNHTSVRDEHRSDPAPWPVDVVVPPDARPGIDAAIAAVLSQRIWAPAPDRRARLLVVGRAGTVSTKVDAGPIGLPWMADAVTRISSGSELQAEAARTPAALADTRFVNAPWQPLLSGADGRPVASAAASSRTLIVASAADATDLFTPLLLREMANSLAPASDIGRGEVLRIPERQLRAWTRRPGTPPAPRADTVDRDDRRWLWGGVLMLLAAEAWMRRTRRDSAEAIEEEPARVA